tara:strand:- start:1222 stop:1428 length:207 start_codon:yes stop_codon:yes gene_type:complete
MKMTQEQCERAVKALQQHGFTASHIQGAPDDHGVWVGVWENELQECHEFRIHDEEIAWWELELKKQTT